MQDRLKILYAWKPLFRFHATESSQRWEGLELKTLVKQITAHCHHLPHGKSSENGANTEAIQMSQKAKGQNSSSSKADHIKGNLDFGIGNMGNLSQLPRKKVCRDNGESAAVR